MLRHGPSGPDGTEEHVPLRDRSHGDVQGNLGRRGPCPGHDADPPPQTPGLHPKVPQGTNHTDTQDRGSQGHLGQHDLTGRLRDQLPPVGSSALSDVRDAVQGPHICPRGANHVRLHQYNQGHPHDPLVHGPTGTASHHYNKSPLVRQNCPQIHSNRVPGLIPDQTVQPTAEPVLPLHAVQPHCHNVFGRKAQVQAVRGGPQHRGVPAEEGAAADHHGQVRQLPGATPHFPDSRYSHVRLVTVLQRLSNMIRNIGLKVSPTKTKALHFGTKTDLRNPNLLLGNTPLEWVDEFRYLRVVLDRKLTFTPHANHLVLKAQRRLDVMKVMASLTGVQAHILRQMYTATVRSTLEYGI